jgi:hypothetical protein
MNDKTVGNLPPDLSEFSTNDICLMLLACSLGNDKSDIGFIKACRSEISKRKPVATSEIKKETHE